MNRMHLICFSVAVLAACSRSHVPESDSETHFLEVCDQSCPDGLECLCGVCTRPCEDDLECSDLDAAARCDAPVSTDGRQCAPTELAPGICQLEPLAPQCGGVWPGDFVTPGSYVTPGDGGESTPLEALAGYERVEGALVIQETSTTDLRVLSCLLSAQSLTIAFNGDLATLEGLENLSLTHPHVEVFNNPKLHDISALGRIGVEGIQEVTGQIYFDWNELLESLEGLQGLRHADGVYIGGAIESLAGLRGLESVDGDLRVAGCTRLTTLDLPGLRELGFLNVQGNPMLRGGAEKTPQSLGLTSLRVLSEGMQVWDNPMLGWRCYTDASPPVRCPPFVPSTAADGL